MAIVIVLDLSRPNELVSVTECLLRNICEIISPFIKKQSNERRSSISRNKAERMSSSNIKKLLPNLSIPIIIMANKYDLFQVSARIKLELSLKFALSQLIGHGTGRSSANK